MTDTMHDVDGHQGPAIVPQACEMLVMPPDADQPSDAGFEDYDLDPSDDAWRLEAWRLLEDIVSRTPSAGHRHPSGTDDRR